MTLFMPPILRKKKVDERYNPDSFRVISEDAQSDHPKYRPFPYRASFEPRTPTPKAFNDSKKGKENLLEPSFPSQPLKTTRVLPQVLPDFRGNKPQPLSCGFLDKNVRFLNEPICNVYTKPVQSQEKKWWPSQANPGELLVPPYAEGTEYRYNYKLQGKREAGSGRHTANSNRLPARGTAPVSYLGEKNGSKRLFKEGISYEHMYNSRLDPNYPIRGNRHGGFVWSRMDPISERKFVEYYKKQEQEQKATTQKTPSAESGLINSRTNNDINQEPQSGQMTNPMKPEQAGEKSENVKVVKIEKKSKSEEINKTVKEYNGPETSEK